MKSGSEKSAFDTALRILASGANSEKMLREKLSMRGYEDREIKDAVENVKEEKLLNDRKLFMSYAEYLANRKLLGTYRLRFELNRKFDKQITDSLYEQAIEEIDFTKNAECLAEKNAYHGREFVIRKLKRQGYSLSEIKNALMKSGLNNSKE